MGKPVADAGDLRKDAEKALRLERQGRHDEALTRVDQLAAKHPGSAMVLHLAGHIHLFAARRAVQAGQSAEIEHHFLSAQDYIAAAKRLVPNCIDISLARAIALHESSKHEEAEGEARIAMNIEFPVDPAENNIEYIVDDRMGTRDRRVENSRESALLFSEFMANWICNNHVPRVVREVLDTDERQGAAKALKMANDLSKRYVYSSGAQCIRAYMKLKFVRSLDATIDKRPFLDAFRVNMNEVTNIFHRSLGLTMFHAKVCFVLGLYNATEVQCRRAFVIEPADPQWDYVPPDFVNGEERAARISSIREELERLFRRVVCVAKDYWYSMTSEKQDNFLSVRLVELHKYYDENYENEHWAARTISDALSFVKKKRSWRFWVCPFCAGKKLPDIDSLLRHMHSKHSAEEVLSKLQFVFIPKQSDDTSKDDYILDDISVCQDSDYHYVFRFKKRDYIFEQLFYLPISKFGGKSFAEIREEKCKEGSKTLQKMKQKLTNLPADKLSTEFDNARPEIEDLWHDFLKITALDYRVVILPLVKYFIWTKLMKHMEDNAASKSITNDDIDAIFPNVVDEQQTMNMKPSCLGVTLKMDEEHGKSVVDVPGSNGTVEHVPEPYNRLKDHKSGDSKQTMNSKPLFSDVTLKMDEEHKKSEVHVEDENSGATVNDKPSEEPIKMVGYGKKLNATLENVGTDLKYDFHVEDENFGAMVDQSTKMIKAGNKLHATPENLGTDLKYDSSNGNSLPCLSDQSCITENVGTELRYDSTEGTSLRSSSDQNHIAENTASHLLGTSDQPAEEMASISRYKISVDVLKKYHADEDLFFLNVIMQSLWHLRCFHNEILRRRTACFQLMHEGPCIAGKLYEIFFACEKTEHFKMAPLLTDVKTNLCKIAHDSTMFHKMQVGSISFSRIQVGRNFASDIMAMIFEGLHKCETYLHFGSNGKNERVVIDPASCTNFICRAHDLFGIKLKQLMSCSCGEWFGEEYTSFFHGLDASSLYTTKTKSLAQLPLLMDQQLNCEIKCNKCHGSVKHIDCFLSHGPHFFTIVLKNWQAGDVSKATMSEAFFGIASPFDITLMYRGATLPCEGVRSSTKYNLVLVICHVEQSYVCFVRDQDKWHTYGIETVKVFDSWEDLLERYKQVSLRPEVLFFEVIK